MLLNPKISNKILCFHQKQHTGILVGGFFSLNKKSRLYGYLAFHRSHSAYTKASATKRFNVYARDHRSKAGRQVAAGSENLL